jgi:tetratricopeptide (TPR) repeat protein
VLNLPFSIDHLADGTALLERAVRLEPSFAVAKAFLAATLINSNASAPGATYELSRAEALLADAAAISPNSLTVLSVSVYLLRAQWHWKEALATAQRLMELYPTNPEAYNQLATMKFATGALDEAIALQENSIRLDPRNPWLFERYQRIGYGLLVLNRERESIPWFERALASNADIPPSPRLNIYRQMATAYALIGNSDEAKRVLGEAGRLDHFTTVRSGADQLHHRMAGAHLCLRAG